MKFRLCTLNDVPDLMRLYSEYLEDRPETQVPYPLTDDLTVEEFGRVLTVKLAESAGQQSQNVPMNWFMVGASTAKRNQPDDGTTRGNKIKGFLAIGIRPRFFANPKLIADFELMVVDRRFQRRGIARKMTQLGAQLAWQRGAQVLECSWAPGTVAAELWPAIGLRPYQVTGAYVINNPGHEDDWQPRPPEGGIWRVPEKATTE